MPPIIPPVAMGRGILCTGTQPVHPSGGANVWAVLSGRQPASINDKHAADMAMLNLVINSRVVNPSGARVVCNAIFTATGELIRRLQIQPEALRRL